MGGLISKPDVLYKGALPLQEGYSLSYWLAGVRSSPLLNHRTTSDLPITADYVIIGSGMSGSMLAYFLMHDPSFPKNAKVIMIDSREFCSGASSVSHVLPFCLDDPVAGRNGGHMRPDSYDVYGGYAKRFGKKAALDLIQLEQDSVRIVKDLVESEHIDCDFSFGKAANIYMSQKDVRRVRAELAEYQAVTNDDLEFIDEPKETQRRTRVKDAQAAVFYQAGSFYPYKFSAHLVQSCLDKGLNLQTSTHVYSVDSDGEKGHVVKTSRGNITARRVIHCTNGWAGAALPEVRRHLKPYRGTCSSITPTRPFSGSNLLDHSQILVWDDEQQAQQGRIRGDGEYLIHRPADGTTILGGGYFDKDWLDVTDDRHVDQASRHFLASYMSKFYHRWGGEAPGEGLNRCWSGIMAKTADGIPLCGSPEPGIYSSVGMGGHGMPRIPALSKGLAKLLLADVGAPFSASGLPAVLEWTERRAAW